MHETVSDRLYDPAARVMILAAFALLAGVLALLALPAQPGWPILACSGLALLAGVVARRRAAGRILFFGSCGFFFAALQTHQYLQWVWPEKSAGERVLTQAVVGSIPAARGEGWTFDARIKVEAPEALDHELNVRLISREAAVQPHAGERWRLLLTLRPPRAALNPGAVDFERLLFHDQVHAMGTVIASRLNQRLEPSPRSLDALRERVADHVEEKVADRDAAALIAALAVGATGSMSREQWRVFNATGTTHLVAISGMHVTMFAIVMFAVARGLWSIWAWRWVSWPRETFAAAFGLGAATGYAFLAGLSIPTQRTLIMLASWLLARSMARASPPLQPLAIALLAVLVLDPFAPLTAGFWLSFGAMGAILFVIQTCIVRRAALHEAVTVQLAVAAVLVPLTFACFGSISVLGPIVNAAAIPYISWLLVPVILLALALMPLWPSVSDFALHIAEWLHNFAWPWLARAADSPLALAHASPPTWWYVLAAAGIAVALLPWPLRLRAAVIACLLPLVAAGHHSPSQGGVEITVLDVGEGMAAIVQTARHVLVYGTGESYGTEGSRVDNVLVPFLRSRGARAVDALLVSKLTPVTGAGMTALLAAMPVKQTLIGTPAVADFPGARACNAGDTWSWDGVRFQIQESCQLRVQPTQGLSELSHAALGLSDQAGHRWTIVCGRSERDGKTRPMVAAWRQAGTRVLATGDVGAVRVVIDPKSGVAAPEGLRTLRRAIWRTKSAYPVF